MSTFFIDQQKAKRKTRYLVFLYLLAILLIILSIYLVIVTFTSSSVPRYVTDPAGVTHIKANFDYLYNPKLFLHTFITVSLLIGSASLIKKFQLGGSGARVALGLGGKPVLAQTTDANEKKILNIVEEMSIASGLKVPPVYIMESPNINAFAAGTTPGNAVIGISRGAIDKLSRDELQGVVAHEFSHILHGDMALNIRLISLLFGILFVATIGRLLFRLSLNSTSRRSSNNNQGGIFAIGAIGFFVMLIGYIGVFFANLIKMAVSRQREFLADASAVQYTRNPLGIAGALKKIGAYSGRINHPNAEEASHMFFANGLTNAFANLFSTHPPLDIRIKKLDPAFDGNFQAYAKAQLVPDTPAENKTQQTEEPSVIEEILDNPGIGIMTKIGSLTHLNQSAAKKLIGDLSQDIKEAAHEPYSACLLVYSLLLDENTAIRKKQLSILQQDLPNRFFNDFQKIEISLSKVKNHNFLSILDLTIPALNQLSKSQYIQLKNLADKLAHADEKIDLYEFTLFKILARYFDKKFYPEKFKINQNKSLKELVKPASNLFLALSVLGNWSKQQEAEDAYLAACKYSGVPESLIYNFNNLPEVNLKFLDQSLEAFDGVDYQVKEVILRAAVTCISNDKKINQKEFTLIRAIADSFDCPVPLFS